MRTITTTKDVFTFDELSEDIQDKAIENLYDLNVDYDWWNSVYEDANNAGIKITAFDIDRGHYCEGEFVHDACYTAHKIVEEHGATCETYKTAEAFLEERDEAVNTADRDENGDVDEYELDTKLDDIERDFLSNILQDYRIMLSKEYEYQTSREAIIESIEANAYEFDANGELA